MTCCVDAVAGNFPPGHAAFAALDASILGPTVALSGATNLEGSHWSPSLSAALYRVNGWGGPYFVVNASSNILVHPYKSTTMSHQEMNLMKIVKVSVTVPPPPPFKQRGKGERV
jgi:arginine decarboxylase